MGIATEIREAIEKRIAQTSPESIKRQALGLEQFLLEQSAILAQAKVDKVRLEAAGFDWGEMAIADGLFEYLALALRDRTTARLDTPEAKAEFDRKMKEAWRDRVVLKEVAAYIVKRCGSRDVEWKFQDAIKGKGRTKLLTGNLDLVSLMGQYPRWALEIRPEGRVADSQFLTEAAGRALELLKTKGMVIRNGSPLNAAVARQNILVHLCNNCKLMIKEYAHAAFISELDYYRQYYCSAARRKTA